MYKDDLDEDEVVIMEGKALLPKLVMPMPEALDGSAVVDCPDIEENVAETVEFLVIEGSRVAEAAGSAVLEAAEPAMLDEVFGPILVEAAGSAVAEVAGPRAVDVVESTVLAVLEGSGSIALVGEALLKILVWLRLDETEGLRGKVCADDVK